MHLEVILEDMLHHLFRAAMLQPRRRGAAKVDTHREDVHQRRLENMQRLRAMRIRKMIARDIDDLMSRYDAIVAPSRPTVATPLDVDRVKSFKERSQDIIGAMGNCIGLPAITVPSGFSDEDLPTGIQFLGRAYDENVILSIANAYQSMTAWHERHPVDVISES